MATSFGWGLDRWGLDDFSSVPGSLFLVSAVAMSTNTVRVTLSEAPLSSNVLGVGDALNPATWLVTRVDTGASFTVQLVTKISDTVFDVLVLEPFASVLVQHEIRSSTLEKLNGELIGAPSFAFFSGVLSDAVSTPENISASRRFSAQDLANPPATVSGSSFGGTLIIGPDGDYMIVTGSDFVKKLLIRRLTTRPGEFSHLPNYGIGFAIKEPLLTSDLVKLKKAIESQALLEPEVESVQVSVTLASSGVLTVLLLAKLRKTGEEIELAFQPPATGSVVL